MAAAKKNFTVEKWADFNQRFQCRSKSGRPIDLSNCSAKVQFRTSAASTDVLFEISTANGRIKPLGKNGVIQFDVPSEITGAITFPAAVYDLVVTFSDGSKVRILEGKISVSEGVTR